MSWGATEPRDGTLEEQSQLLSQQREEGHRRRATDAREVRREQGRAEPGPVPTVHCHTDGQRGQKLSGQREARPQYMKTTAPRALPQLDWR